MLFLEVVDECIGALIVELLEAGMEAAGDKEAEGTLARQHDLVGGPCRHQLNVDDVAVVIIQHQHVTVAGSGSGGEAAGLISVYLASRLVIYYFKYVY